MFRIIEKLGGWGEVQKILASRGIELTDAAYRQWRSKNRRALPQNVRLALELEATKRALKYDESDFDFIAPPKSEAAA